MQISCSGVNTEVLLTFLLWICLSTLAWCEFCVTCACISLMSESSCSSSDWDSVLEVVSDKKVELSSNDAGPRGLSDRTRGQEWKVWCCWDFILGCCIRRSAVERTYLSRVSDRQHIEGGVPQLFCCTVWPAHWFLVHRQLSSIDSCRDMCTAVGRTCWWTMCLCHFICTLVSRMG